MITFKEGLTIGDNSPIRINCNVGCNNIADIESELSKLEFIQSCNELPDMMMDLSLIELKKPLYKFIRNKLGLPLGQYSLIKNLLNQKDYNGRMSEMLFFGFVMMVFLL